MNREQSPKLTRRGVVIRGLLQGCGLVFLPFGALVAVFGISDGGRAPGTGGYDLMLYSIVACIIYIVGFVALCFRYRFVFPGALASGVWGVLMGIGACFGYALVAELHMLVRTGSAGRVSGWAIAVLGGIAISQGIAVLILYYIVRLLPTR